MIEACVKKHNTSYYCDLETPSKRGGKLNAFGLAFKNFPASICHNNSLIYTTMCNKLWSREVPGERFNQERILAEVIATARKVTGMMFSVLDDDDDDVFSFLSVGFLSS